MIATIAPTEWARGDINGTPFHQCLRGLDTLVILILPAEPDRVTVLLEGTRPIGRKIGELAELGVGAPVHPVPRRVAERGVERAAGGAGFPQRDECCAVVVAPSGELAEGAGPRVAGKHREPVLDGLSRNRRTSGPERRRTAVEPQQTIPRIVALQLSNHAQRIVEPGLAVVDDDKREARVRLNLARIRGRLLDHAKAAFTSAAKACQPRHHPRGERQRGDRIPVEADREPGVAASGIQIEDALVLGVGAARGAQAAEEAAFDRGGVGRLVSVGGAKLKMRVGAAIGQAALLGERHRAIEVGPKNGSKLRWRRATTGAGLRFAEIVFGGDRALLKEHRDPNRRGGEPVRGRMRGIGGHRLAKRVDRGVAIEVVAKPQATGAKRRGRGRVDAPRSTLIAPRGRLARED